MSSYLDYLDKNYSKKTFSRKVNYIKYNFQKYLTFENIEEVRILEIGAGLGENIKYFNDRGFTNIDIIDNDQSVLNNISKSYKIQRALFCEQLDKLESLLDKYDAVIATQVMEHIPRNEQMLFVNTLYKSLKAGGYIIITVPNMANPFTLYERYGDLTHETAFTDNSLRQLCLNCNIPLSKVKIQGFQIPPYSLLNVIRIFFQKVLHGIILLLSIINAGGYSKKLTPNITLVIKK